MKHFCFGASKSEAPRSERRRMASAAVDSCIFCPIARGSTSTTLLYAVKSLFSPLFPLKFGPKLTSFFTFRALIQDEKVVAFPDVNPSAFRYFVEHLVCCGISASIWGVLGLDIDVCCDRHENRGI